MQRQDKRDTTPRSSAAIHPDALPDKSSPLLSSTLLDRSRTRRKALLCRRASKLIVRGTWTHVISFTVFAVAWILILSLHGINAIVALIAGAVHLLLCDPAIYKAIRAVQIPQEALVISAWTYLAIGILHVYEVLAMVFRSLWYRRLVFSAVTKEKRPPEHLHVLDRQTATTRERLCKPFARLVAVLDRYSGLNGYFGVNGQLFDLVFHSLEVLEMVTQTYQAYQFSRSISHAWIKQFAVAVIVLNGTFPALAHVFLQKNEGARRLVNIVIDLFLDFSSAVLLPVGILTPLLMAFNWTTSSFDPELNVNDVWMTNGIAEARQVLVTSRFDYVASMMPHVGLLLCLNMIKSLLQGAPERRTRRLGHTPSGSTVITLVDLYADVSEIGTFERNQVEAI